MVNCIKQQNLNIIVEAAAISFGELLKLVKQINRKPEHMGFFFEGYIHM